MLCAGNSVSPTMSTLMMNLLTCIPTEMDSPKKQATPFLMLFDFEISNTRSLSLLLHSARSRSTEVFYSSLELSDASLEQVLIATVTLWLAVGCALITSLRSVIIKLGASALPCLTAVDIDCELNCLPWFLTIYIINWPIIRLHRSQKTNSLLTWRRILLQVSLPIRHD